MKEPWQICEYFFENACYSVTKYYLCKQNNKRSLLGRKQRHQVVRSFPNRYLFSFTNKVTSLFPISCILEIILKCYLCQIEAGEIELREHKSARWLTAETLNSVEWLPADKELIGILKTQLTK